MPRWSSSIAVFRSPGTIRTLDGVKGSTPLGAGLISRDGWVVVDDSERPLFDNSDWPWVMQRPQGKRQHLYLFAYGHDYKQALYDYTQVAGKIPLPPRFAFGTWWSRYWAYTDTEFEELVRDLQEHDIPLDVLVIDMDWHPTFGVKWWENRKDQSGHTLGWTGYTWNRIYFPDPPKFLDWVHRQSIRPPRNTSRSTSPTKNLRRTTSKSFTIPSSGRASTFSGLTGSRSRPPASPA
jgi:hypothetical protein